MGNLWAMRSSSETEALLAILRKLAAPEAANAIGSLVLQGSDRDLCRVNALDFAAKRRRSLVSAYGRLEMFKKAYP